MKIELTKYERDFCKMIASLRTSTNRAITPENFAANTGVDPNFIEIEGVMSELAFFKLLDIFPGRIMDTEPRSASKGQDPGDMTVNGYNIDVKATKHQDGQLLSRIKNPNVDLVVLMLGQKGCYRFGGGMWSEDLYQPWRYGMEEKFPQPCFSAPQWELLTPRRVLSILNHTCSSTASTESEKLYY